MRKWHPAPAHMTWCAAPSLLYFRTESHTGTRSGRDAGITHIVLRKFSGEASGDRTKTGAENRSA